MNKIRCVGRWVLAVSCMLAGGLTLEAETFPPAPGIATPPILSEAKLWLDAWDYDTFQFDENGFVTNWVDKSARKADASAYAASSASGASVLGVLGVTNGVPAYLMGAPGSGIDLQFSRISNIRSIFWVMDIVPGDATNARFLGDANSTTKDDFERTSGSIFHWNAPAFAARFWIGDKSLFSWNERRWSISNYKADMTGLQVYSLSSDKNLAASRLSVSYGGGVGKTSGGRALSELVIFDRTLSDEEILQVKSYLTAKWKGVAAVMINEEVSPAEVTGYGDLTLGANASFVLTDAVLGGRAAASISVWGNLDKTAAGKIRLTYAGHVWNRKQALFYAGKGGLTLDDFALTGFPSDAEFECDGKTLMMKVGGSALASAVVSDTTSLGPRLWLDSSSAETFVTNETGGVLKWLDKSPNHNDATNYAYLGEWNYPTVVESDGVAALSLGAVGSSKDLEFMPMNDIRTVFWVMDIAQSGGAHFLGYNRGSEGNQAYLRSMNGNFGYFLYSMPEQVRLGSMKTDGVVISDTRWTAVPTGRHVYSHRVKDDIPAWAGNLSRGYYKAESGGRDLSELIVFNRSLSDAERESVEKQLAGKWWMPATLLTDSTVINSPVEYGRVTMSRSAATSTTTLGAFVFSSSALSMTKPTVRVYGEFRRDRGLGQLEISWTGDEIAPGTYVLLECASMFDCALGDFSFVGFPENAKFYLEGTTLVMKVLGEIKPLVPLALSATDESAPWIWLDASDAVTFTTNEQGGVVEWADKGARGNNATSYQLGAEQHYGTVGMTNGVLAYLMGPCGSGVDLKFPRSTTVRTVFWAMDIAMTDYTGRKQRADFLGDEAALNFMRGNTGQYCHYSTDQRGFTSGVIREDGDIPHDKKANPGYANHQLKPYMPGATHIYSLQAGAEMAASCLSAEQGCATTDTANFNGGRALSELVIFNRALSAAEFADVEAYLDLKWHGKKVAVSELVDATGRVSYPHLDLEPGAGFAIATHKLKVGGESAVTVHGVLTRYGDGKIRIENADSRTRKDVVLLRCAESVNVTIDAFEFVGFPQGTSFVWENNELKVADCPTAGLVIIVQ